MIRWLRRLGLAVAVAIAVAGGAARRLRAARVHGRRLPSAPRVRQAERPLRRARGAARGAARPRPAAGGRRRRSDRGASGGRRRGPRPPPAPPRRATGCRNGPGAAGPRRSRRHRRPPPLDRGPTFAARPATASTASAPSPRPGRPAGRACSGSSRSAKGTRRSSIARGVAYTIEQRRNREVVAAYDIATGRERWTNGWDALFSEAMGGDGPRATPTYADGILYALGAAGELRALRADSGTLVWRTNILRRRRRREPAVGHVRRAADRRRQGDRAARRPRRVDGRLRRHDRPGRCGSRSTTSRPTSRRCW